MTSKNVCDACTSYTSVNKLRYYSILQKHQGIKCFDGIGLSIHPPCRTLFCIKPEYFINCIV